MRLNLAAIAFTLGLAPLSAQVGPHTVSAEQPGWVASPDWSAVTVHISTPTGQSGPVLHKPFSAVEVRHSQQILSNGTRIDHTDTSNFYRDAEGRMRVQGRRVAVLYDPTIDATFTLHLEEKTYNRSSAGGHGNLPTSIAAYGNSNHIDTPGVTGPVEKVKWGQIPYGSEPVKQVRTEDLGERQIAGIACKGLRYTIAIPAHAVGNDREISIVNERWYSDDLKALVKTTNDDPRFGVTTYELENVQLAEPDAALFRLPDGFVRSEKH